MNDKIFRNIKIVDSLAYNYYRDKSHFLQLLQRSCIIEVVEEIIRRNYKIDDFDFVTSWWFYTYVDEEIPLSLIGEGAPKIESFEDILKHDWRDKPKGMFTVIAYPKNL
jgi:hypothetical protein